MPNRLTNKKIIKELKQNSEATITTTENVSRDIYLKFAEFEDFMEEQKVESLEHLAYYLKTLKKARKVNGELNVECCKQKKENQALKEEIKILKGKLNE